MLYSALLFHEIAHFLLSLLATSIIALHYLNRKDRQYHQYFFAIVLGASLGGFFIDADHLFDYFYSFGFVFRPDYFFGGHMFEVSNKVFVPLHAWELIPLFGVTSNVFRNKIIKYFFAALTLGMIFHLIYDAYSNNASFFGYSFTYRAIHSFEAAAFNAH